MELHGFKTLEMRWFSSDVKLLNKIFDHLAKEYTTTTEQRTDHYLKIPLEDTGIKIREGNHELKVKFQPDVELDIGKKEFWMKWSHPTDDSILSLVGKEGLTHWIAIEKERKSLRISFEDNNDEGIFSPEGVSVECTHLHIPFYKARIYTMGIESYSLKNRMERYFNKAIGKIRIFEKELKELYSGGYPAWMKYKLINHE